MISVRQIFNLSLVRSSIFRGYKSLTSNDIDFFKNLLKQNALKTDDLEPYNIDWLKIHRGQSRLALLPSSTEHVSKILSYCNSRELPVVIQGGNTSLVAGAVPVSDEIILLTSNMNKVEFFDETTGFLQCQSGCILQNLEEFVEDKGYTLPYDLGARASCQIGGNISTNAGGIRFIRFGSLHASVLGLEVVLADGTIIDIMSQLKKDNTGLDLKHLFIGSEGILGVITRVCISCPIKMPHKILSFLSTNKFENVLRVLDTVRKKMSNYLTAFEMIDLSTLEATKSQLLVKPPFESEFCILIEASVNNIEQTEEEIGSIFQTLMDDKTIINCTYSSDHRTIQKLWGLRENCAEALRREGYCYKYDISLPEKYYYQLVEIIRQRLSNDHIIRVSGYGHVGDCNLHLTVVTKEYNPMIHSKIEPFIFEWISDKKGSISAEHGLGMTKKKYLNLSKSPEVIRVMKDIKRLFDPKNILNPGKMLPD